MSGKTMSAIEFKIKIVPNATDVSSAPALMAGETAAIALPPQIAVTEAISVDVLSFIFNNLPTKNPRISVPKIEAIVNKIPSFPALTTAVKFIPKPSNTTEICNKYLVAFLVWVGNGLPKVKAEINPKIRAIVGDKKRQTISRIVKRIFCHDIKTASIKEKRSKENSLSTFF